MVNEYSKAIKVHKNSQIVKFDIEYMENEIQGEKSF